MTSPGQSLRFLFSYDHTYDATRPPQVYSVVDARRKDGLGCVEAKRLRDLGRLISVSKCLTPVDETNFLVVLVHPRGPMCTAHDIPW